MLGRGEGTAVRDQFRELLERRAVASSNYEATALTEQYLEELCAAVAGKEEALLEETERMEADLRGLDRQLAQGAAALRAVGLDDEHLGCADRASVGRLAELAELLGAEGCSAGALTAALDRRVRRHQRRRAELDACAELEERSSRIARELSELHARLYQARSEFVSWGRRDCELGVRELAAATSTVLQKRAEYQQRLQHLQTMPLRRDTPAAAVERKLTAIIAKRAQLKEVEEALSPYNRLPPDISLASVEIERARQELERLSSQRDLLLQNYR